MFKFLTNLFTKKEKTYQERRQEMSALEKARIERARLYHTQRSSASRTTEPTTPVIMPDPYPTYVDTPSHTSHSHHDHSYDSGSSSFSSCD